MRSQQTTESSNTNGDGARAPPACRARSRNTPTNAGAPHRRRRPAPSGPSQTSNASKKDNTVNYELDRTVETKRLPVGTIKRLSAAIVVNHRPSRPRRPRRRTRRTRRRTRRPMRRRTRRRPRRPRPLTKEEIDQITALARESMGFDEKRGDSINVVNASFTQPDVPVAVDVPMWKDPDNISTAKDVGKNAAFALLARTCCSACCGRPSAASRSRPRRRRR